MSLSLTALKIGSLYRQASSAEWLYKTVVKCFKRRVEKYTFDNPVDVDVLFVVINPMWFLVESRIVHFETMRRKAKKIVAIAMTEGEIFESVAEIMSKVDIAFTFSRFVRDLYAKIGVSLDLVKPGIEVTDRVVPKEMRPLDIIFVNNNVPGGNLRKGADIFAKVVKNLDALTIGNIQSIRIWFEYSVEPPYELAKILLFPSRSEGFGLPPLEAMAVGTVPVCSDAPAHNEFCTVKVPTRYLGSVHLPLHPYPFFWYESCWKDYVVAIKHVYDNWEKYSDLSLRTAMKFPLDEFCNYLEYVVRKNV